MPNEVAGYTFTISAPFSKAVKISVGVNAPGILTAPYLLVVSIVLLLREGEMIKLAPSKMAALADSGSSTVPAPIIRSSPSCFIVF
jgi:hypothetical protein